MGLAKNFVRMLVTATALTGFTILIQPNLTELLKHQPTPQEIFAIYLALLLLTLTVSTILIRILAARTE